MATPLVHGAHRGARRLSRRVRHSPGDSSAPVARGGRARLALHPRGGAARPMTTGGLRDRLLKDSFFAQVQKALDVLGGFGAGRSHKLVTLLEQPNHWDVPCEPNTIAVNFLGSEISEWEVGSL